MANEIIEPEQFKYLQELIEELGQIANSFVLAGARALNFSLPEVRPTKDFDFVLDVTLLRNEKRRLSEILEKLCYQVDPNAQRFQFFKHIPGSKETIRKVAGIIKKYYADLNSPGVLLYREFLQKEGKGFDEDMVRKALREIRILIKN